ncbi:BMP-binding endothelial regulator protein-like [Mya arenaria]|uniref:BMP-binding endothelial regulator protein-like n=1 Tax=Mya arenaria TaxID=6604 RepID=UPI0022E84109|nr:BMP-binding endothelial regulator protein-like [Mya arenaria]XP_052814284.1 BMP-binding endothelial regulator protein-like [Mya arenaria]XP_052814285.1 BMP-binding endothelial regulator protein-like [Mya arenaria]XP_052814286.1 BMP-binding endothelial regulator protein-like [Mya arenaria]XP_052814287.1 BMP-binding endothelial regulator protein-like [Mya arenaria]
MFPSNGVTVNNSVGLRNIIWIIIIMCFNKYADSQLSGSFASCKRDGDPVYIPMVSDNPCISCFCSNKIVKCSQTQCPNVEGCYVILFDNFLEDKKCCDVCKGCMYKGRTYASGESWTDPRDPCTTFTCRASVITRSRTQCYSPCSDPVEIPGQCCPSCQGCYFDGRRFADGDRFNLTTDSCVQCSCKAGSVSCEQMSCPVLNCPKAAIYTVPEDCCPRCKGQRNIYNLPGGRCFYQKKIYSDGRLFKPDTCTKCQCKNGTSLCERETCPHLSCAKEQRLSVPGSCCQACPKKKQCLYEGVFYADAQQWKPDTCKVCDCDNGVTHCQTQHCNNALWCPQGYTLQFDDKECCPTCIETRAVCTVYGDPHYKTFDGKLYNFQGPCKYILTEDCLKKSFSVRVRNDAKTSSSFTWTKTVVIFIEGVKIHLLQRLRVKVNRKRVYLPYKHNEIPAFTIIQTGHTVVLNWSRELMVTWDGDSFVEVSISSRYKRKLCGLCGNFNGLQFDDFTGKDGRQYMTGEEFGETWRYGSRSACVIRPEVTSESQCLNDTVASVRAKRECSFLLGSVFHRCRRVVDVRPYYSSCLTDTCECPQTKRCECEAFRAYGRTCAQHGMEIDWEPVAPCAAERKCPVGSKFKKCATPCPKTCENYNKIEPCLKPCIKGCQCRSGLVLHNNACIPPASCPAR